MLENSIGQNIFWKHELIKSKDFRIFFFLLLTNEKVTKISKLMTN